MTTASSTTQGFRLVPALAALTLSLLAGPVCAQAVGEQAAAGQPSANGEPSPSAPAAPSGAPVAEDDRTAQGEGAVATSAVDQSPTVPEPADDQATGADAQRPEGADPAANTPPAGTPAGDAPPASAPPASPPESARSAQGPVAPARAPTPAPALAAPAVPAAATVGAAGSSGASGPGSLQFMPGRFVQRPLTAPRGTLVLGLTSGSVFIDSEPEASTAPIFALGITSRLELGLAAPLRYDQGAELWTALEPVPHVAAIFFAAESFELGGKVSLRVPTRPDTDPLVQLAIPALIRANEYLRVDLTVVGELSFEDKTEVSVRVPAAATIQVTPWFFTGAKAALDLGLSSNRTTGLDAGLLAGVTYHSQEQANVDLSLELFMENIGGGRLDRFSDGGGLLLAVQFFPELY